MLSKLTFSLALVLMLAFALVATSVIAQVSGVDGVLLQSLVSLASFAVISKHSWCHEDAPNGR